MNPNAATQQNGDSGVANPNGQGNLPTVNPNAAIMTPTANGSSSSAMSVAGLQQPQTAITTPTQPSVNTGTADNASVTSPIPTTQDIVNKDTQSTATQGQQSDILGKVAGLMQGKTSLATLQTNEEANAGVPGMTKTVNDLNTQIQGLADQSTALQNDAANGGAIQNQEQNSVIGRGVTAGGLQAMNSADLRNNQIKQAAIASHSLTLKSAVYAAQGNLTLAKDAADKAAQVQFDATQQQIDYENSLLAAIQPQLDKDQKAQAAQLQADLADRQTQVNTQIENYKTGQAAIADALKNNPDNPQAQVAAQQAAQLDPKDPNYLTKVNQLVAPYASDVTKRALDIATQKGQLALQPGQLALQNAQIQEANLNAQKTAIDIQNLKGAGVNIGTNNIVTTVDGTRYIDGTNISGTDATMVQRYAAANGIPFVGKDQADTLQNIANAQLNQTDIINQIKGLLPKDSAGHVTANLTVPLSQLFQSNDTIAAYGSWRTAAINSLKATAGSKGLRINKSEIEAAVTNDIPLLTDTLGTAQQKFNNINTLLQNAQDSILVKDKQGLMNTATEPQDRSKGTTWVRPDGTYTSDGTQWVKTK